MAGSEENDLGASNHQGGKSTTEMEENRRVLVAIDDNIMVAEPNPFALHKTSAFTEIAANVACKNPKIPIFRPITRQFSVQIASKKLQPTQKGTVPSMSRTSVPKDCPIIDLDDYKPNTDISLSMEENDHNDDEYLIVDIDSPDKKNPLAVVEYIDDIYAFYKKTENLSCVPPDYMNSQPDINDKMRAILIDWLIEVHYKLELMEETLYLTVNLIDRFLAIQPIVRKKLKLVGVTAMLLACKYEEVSVPIVEDFIVITGKDYCGQELLDMEKLMVDTLQFNVSLPTTYVFMRRFLKAAEPDKKMEFVSFFMVDLCLVEYKTLRFTPSHIAAAAVYTARCVINGCKDWSRMCEKHTNYTQDQLMECSRVMVNLHKNAANGKPSRVHRKYNSSKCYFAALSKPALFLLEDDEGIVG